MKVLLLLALFVYLVRGMEVNLGMEVNVEVPDGGKNGNGNAGNGAEKQLCWGETCTCDAECCGEAPQCEDTGDKSICINPKAKRPLQSRCLPFCKLTGWL